MKKLLPAIICLFIFSLYNSFAQEIKWQKTIGGSGADNLYSISATSDGGAICGGTSASNISGDKTEDCLGGLDYWIVKIDSLGNIQWQNTVGGNDEDILHVIIQTSDGGYICAGSSHSGISGDKSEPQAGRDYWIVKLFPNGNVQWENTIGGTGDDYCYDIRQTTDGGFICGGLSSSGISGDKTDSCFGGGDFWILKLDASGNIQWQKTIGTAAEVDRLNSIRQTADGGYICGGNMGVTYNHIYYWFVKLDSAGTMESEYIFITATTLNSLNCAIQTQDGGYIGAGNYYSQYSIMKLDTAGNMQWAKQFLSITSQSLQSILQTPDGGYICAGYSKANSSAFKSEDCIGDYDYWIVRTDAIGNIVWENTIGGVAIDELFSICRTNDGNFICAGFSGSGISGDKSENSHGLTDYWILKLSDEVNAIKGKVFYDFNSNSILDSSDYGVPNILVTEQNTSKVTYSSNDGSYSISLLDTGNYSVSPATPNYYTAAPAVQNVSFTAMQQIDSLNDFALQPISPINDLCIKITPVSRFRPGFNASYMITYENVGTTVLNPTVLIFPSSYLTYVSAIPAPTTVYTDSVLWSFGSLAPYQTGNIVVTVGVNSAAVIGTIVNSSVRVDPIIGDANTSCNDDEYAIVITGSVDPNAILVDRDTISFPQLTNPPWLDYIIYFQNTGNDTAFHVRLLNNIPSFLDINTFELVAWSHPMNMSFSAHSRLMTFDYRNIILPHKSVNEPASHGFVRYRIKPLSTLSPLDTIKNTAYIYFDFNQPVQTNTALTRIILPTGIPDFDLISRSSSDFHIYPNPVADELTVQGSWKQGEKVELRIHDLPGRIIYETQLQTTNFKLQTASFSRGIYFIEVSNDNQSGWTRFVKD